MSCNFVNAVIPYTGEVASPTTNPLIPKGAGISRFEGVVVILMTVLRWTYTIFFIVAVFMILLAAYTYLTAQAEPEKIKSATNQIIYASIAIAVALLAVSINAIVGSIIGPSSGGGNSGASQTQSPTYPTPASAPTY